MKYVAFLRGINVGGNKMVKMDDLKKAFESLGFENVRTLLASGNVVFETTREDVAALTKEIEGKLEKIFGFPITGMLRTSEEIHALMVADPFKHVRITPRTRLLVSFLAEEHKSTLKTPYMSPDRKFNILHIYSREVCSTFELAEQGGTPELMKILEQEFGKKVTTRTWNTVNKIWILLER